MIPKLRGFSFSVKYFNIFKTFRVCYLSTDLFSIAVVLIDIIACIWLVTQNI